MTSNRIVCHKLLLKHFHQISLWDKNIYSSDWWFMAQVDSWLTTCFVNKLHRLHSTNVGIVKNNNWFVFYLLFTLCFVAIVVELLRVSQTIWKQQVFNTKWAPALVAVFLSGYFRSNYEVSQSDSKSLLKILSFIACISYKEKCRQVSELSLV
jgi:hypothetical protein